MRSPEHYRSLADRYAADALRASDPHVRASLLDMASEALKLADQAAAVQPAKRSARNVAAPDTSED
jgi:hypothetical protein